MPLTPKGEEIKAAMQKEYGAKKGEQVLYASKNAGKITGIDKDQEYVEAGRGLTLADLNEQNRRYWEQQGGEFYPNTGAAADEVTKQAGTNPPNEAGWEKRGQKEITGGRDAGIFAKGPDVSKHIGSEHTDAEGQRWQVVGHNDLNVPYFSKVDKNGKVGATQFTHPELQKKISGKDADDPALAQGLMAAFANLEETRKKEGKPSMFVHVPSSGSFERGVGHMEKYGDELIPQTGTNPPNPDGEWEKRGQRVITNLPNGEGSDSFDDDGVMVNDPHGYRLKADGKDQGVPSGIEEAHANLQKIKGAQFGQGARSRPPSGWGQSEEEPSTKQPERKFGEGAKSRPPSGFGEQMDQVAPSKAELEKLDPKTGRSLNWRAEQAGKLYDRYKQKPKDTGESEHPVKPQPPAKPIRSPFGTENEPKFPVKKKSGDNVTEELAEEAVHPGIHRQIGGKLGTEKSCPWDDPTLCFDIPSQNIPKRAPWEDRTQDEQDEQDRAWVNPMEEILNKAGGPPRKPGDLVESYSTTHPTTSKQGATPTSPELLAALEAYTKAHPERTQSFGGDAEAPQPATSPSVKSAQNAVKKVNPALSKSYQPKSEQDSLNVMPRIQQHSEVGKATTQVAKSVRMKPLGS